MVFHTRVDLRWTDLDAQQHVNNVVVADYLQQARAVFMLSGPAGPLLENGCVVVSHAIEYLRPITWSATPLEVDLWVSGLGGARLEISYLLSQDDHPVARARSVLCPFDFARQTPRRLTSAERGFFAGYRGEPLDLAALGAPALGGRGLALDVRTRWSDPDRYGHVNNVRFLEFVLAGRVDMTTRVDPTMARAGMGEQAGGRWLIARQDIDYLAQISFRLSPYRVLTAPVSVGTSSVVIASEIIDPDDDNRVLAAARSVLVSADQDGHKMPLADRTRAAMLANLVG